MHEKKHVFKNFFENIKKKSEEEQVEKKEVVKKTDLEKDMTNPIRRFVRHNLQAKKYGDMVSYHIAASQYHIDKLHELCNPVEEVTEEVEELEVRDMRTVVES